MAAYARVSTDQEEQLTSYEAQVDYYTNYIQGRDDWEFAGIYTDEGITGTNTKKREGFKSMVIPMKASPAPTRKSARASKAWWRMRWPGRSI